MSRFVYTSAVSVLLCALCISRSTLTAAQEVSFAGKTVTIMIGYSPGGIGYDTYGRQLARYLGKHLPGNPRTVASNRAGAGSMTLANYMYNVAPRDGTEIALVGRGIATDRLINGDASTARFESPKFNWLGSMNNEVSGLFLREGAPAASLSDLLAGSGVEAGSTGAGGDQQIFSQALNVLLRMKLHIIPGYPGTNEILLAMQRGELDAIAGYSWSAAKIGNANELRTGQLKIVLQLALRKHPELPNVPLVTELIKDQSSRQALELLMSRQSMGRPVVAPPGLSPGVAQTLRRAVFGVMHDPDFNAEAQSLGLETSYVSGEDVQALVQKLYDLPTEVVTSARRAVTVNTP